MDGSVVAIDAGTSVVKCSVFSSDGQPIALGRAPVQLLRGQDGAVREDMWDVWAATIEATRSALSKAPQAPIKAVTVCGQGDGAWLVDDVVEPIGPAATWLDGRARDIVREWQHDGKAGRYESATGTRLFAGALPPMLAWLTLHEPDLIERARWHLNCKDWIRFRLTGKICTDPTDAAKTALDPVTGVYDEQLFDELDLGSLRHLLPEVRPSDAIAGTIQAAAAEATGLPRGCPVIVGLLDGTAASIGLGAVRPDMTAAVIGTTCSYMVVTDRAQDVGSGVDFGPQGATPYWLRSLAPMDGTTVLEWARRSIAGGAPWETVEQMVSETKLGARGLLFLPYLSGSGERAPVVRPDATATFVGLSSSHGQADMLRAAYEGVALAMADCLDLLLSTGEVRMGGGGARSGALAQLMADILQRPVVVPADLDPGARGGAALASVAIGMTQSLSEAVTPGFEPVQRYEPDAQLAGIATELVGRFRAVRDSMGDTWETLRIRNAQTTPGLPDSGADHPDGGDER